MRAGVCCCMVRRTGLLLLPKPELDDRAQVKGTATSQCHHGCPTAYGCSIAAAALLLAVGCVELICQHPLLHAAHLELLQGETAAQLLLAVVLDGLPPHYWSERTGCWAWEQGLRLLSASCT